MRVKITLFQYPFLFCMWRKQVSHMTCAVAWNGKRHNCISQVSILSNLYCYLRNKRKDRPITCLLDRLGNASVDGTWTLYPSWSSCINAVCGSSASLCQSRQFHRKVYRYDMRGYNKLRVLEHATCKGGRHTHAGWLHNSWACHNNHTICWSLFFISLLKDWFISWSSFTCQPDCEILLICLSKEKNAMR